MKVYFSASIHEKDAHVDNYRKIVEYLKSKGNRVYANHIFNASEESIHESSREEVLHFHTKLENWIKSSDFMVAETSFPSISVGYEISMALRLGKPTLILYSEGGAPSVLSYHKDDRLVTEKYDESTYKHIIDDFITYVEAKADMRFTFFITPDIALYLDEVSKKEKLPKSVYLRQLIEEDMRKK